MSVRNNPRVTHLLPHSKTADNDIRMNYKDNKLDAEHRER